MLSAVSTSSRLSGLSPRYVLATRALSLTQARSFWMGALWSSRDPSLAKNIHIYHKRLRRHYDAIQRQIERETERDIKEAKAQVKRFMRNCWHPRPSYWDPRPDERHYFRSDKAQPTRDYEPGARPGNNIEDVERSAINKLFSTGKSDPLEYDIKLSPLENIKRYLYQQDKTSSPSSKTDATTTSANTDATESSDYVIDPITNRKVPKSQSLTHAKSMDRKPGPKPSQFDPQQDPIHSDGPPPESELREYQNVDINYPPSMNEELIHRLDDLPKQPKAQPSPKSRPRPATEAPEPPPEIKDELEGYRKVDINYPPSMNEELIHRVDDLPKYDKPTKTKGKSGSGDEGTTFYREVSDLGDRHSRYDDLHMYKPYMDGEVSKYPTSGVVATKSWPSRVRRPSTSQDGSSSEAPPNVMKDMQNESPVEPLMKSKPASAHPEWAKDLPKLRSSLPRESQIQKDEREQVEGVKFQDLQRFGADDFYSKEPMGMETSWSEECLRDPKASKPYVRMYGGLPEDSPARANLASGNIESTQSAQPDSANALRDAQKQKNAELVRDFENSYQDKYGSVDTAYHKEFISSIKEEQEAERAAETVAAEEQSTLYKILAYDPTTQTINIAETTSVAPDSAKPLSPTEVMLKLSNPSKFFPHFGPIQAQGFEIVSGSGDVLVFRKIREVVEPPPVNPIDMMGRQPVPDMGGFASPTGFVNYDFPIREIEPETAKSKVRREEDVFSGPRVEQYDTKPKKGGFLKKTAKGVAYVAGTAYVIGAACELEASRHKKPVSTL